MPARPPDNEFYNSNDENFMLWRDVSRLWEDWAPADAPDRKERFETVLTDILARLDAASFNDRTSA